MISDVIKFFFIFNFSWYISLKLLHIPCNKLRNISLTFLSIILAITTHLMENGFVEIKYVTPLCILWCAICFISQKPQISFVATSVSFGISYSFYAISSFLLAVATYFLRGTVYVLPYFVLAVLSGLCESLLIYFLFRTKRLRNGMRFLYSTNTINLATVACLFFIFISVYVHQNSSFRLGILSFFFLLAFLIYWWQAQITKSYRRSLELRELESLRTADIEKDILIQKLLKDNERLATITHRDNTLITTLKNSTVNYLMTDFEDSEEAKAVRDKLVAHIESLSEGRTSLPPDYREKKARDFNTGISILDEMLHHMDETAIEKNITFSVHLGTELVDFVPQNISESDLVHTVDDLLKNAFKSTLTCEKRAVQLQFYKLGKHFVVEVADNGIPFEVRSLVNMGIEKLTTYENGSGIGLMDIWNTKEKYGATYHLEEYAAPAPFSKKISLTFDKKNRYSIRTWRKDEILQMSKRADLQVYDYEE